MSHKAAIIKSLLDEAFRVLQHDSPEDDPEYVHLRDALGKSFWRVLKDTPIAQPSAVALDDERAAFEQLTHWPTMAPRDVFYAGWRLARAAFPQATAKCRACNGNDGDMPCAYPEGHPNCLRNEKATATQPAQTERALTDEQRDAVEHAQQVLRQIEAGDGVFVNQCSEAIDGLDLLLTAAQPASGADHE